jgi:kynurenine formamidase
VFEQLNDGTACELVDLTLLLAEELPSTWSGHMPYQQKTFTYFADQEPNPANPLFDRVGSYQTRWLLMDEHTGTHVDAPAHFLPEPGTGLPNSHAAGTITVDQLRLRQLMGPAVVVDIPEDTPGSAPGVSPTITAEFLRSFEDHHGRFAANDVVLLRSRWDRHYLPGRAGDDYCYNPVVLKTTPGHPAPDAEAMALLVERGVRCVGTDGPSMGSVHDGVDVHVLGLAHEVAFIEALGNLSALPVRGAFFLFAPLKVARGTGAPGRAMAWIPLLN